MYTETQKQTKTDARMQSDSHTHASERAHAHNHIDTCTDARMRLSYPLVISIILIFYHFVVEKIDLRKSIYVQFY